MKRIVKLNHRGTREVTFVREFEDLLRGMVRRRFKVEKIDVSDLPHNSNIHQSGLTWYDYRGVVLKHTLYPIGTHRLDVCLNGRTYDPSLSVYGPDLHIMFDEAVKFVDEELYGLENYGGSTIYHSPRP